MMPPTSGRRIQFTRDVTRVSTLTNMPYSPTKISWQGREVITQNQLQNEVRKKCIKMMARKGQGKHAPNSFEI